jgi:hypothetical protein
MDRVTLEGENMCALPFLVGFMVSLLVSHLGIYSGHLICSKRSWALGSRLPLICSSRFLSLKQFCFSEFLCCQEPKTCFSLSLSLSLSVCVCVCVCVQVQRDKVIISYNHHQNFRLYLQFLYVSAFFTFANCLDYLNDYFIQLHQFWQCSRPIIVLSFYCWNIQRLIPHITSMISFDCLFVPVYSLKTLMMALLCTNWPEKNVAWYCIVLALLVFKALSFFLN